MDECSPALCASTVINTTHLDSIAIGVMASDLEIIATVSPGKKYVLNQFGNVMNNPAYSGKSVNTVCYFGI